MLTCVNLIRKKNYHAARCVICEKEIFFTVLGRGTQLQTTFCGIIISCASRSSGVNQIIVTREHLIPPSYTVLFTIYIVLRKTYIEFFCRWFSHTCVLVCVCGYCIFLYTINIYIYRSWEGLPVTDIISYIWGILHKCCFAHTCYKNTRIYSYCYIHMLYNQAKELQQYTTISNYSIRRVC